MFPLDNPMSVIISKLPDFSKADAPVDNFTAPPFDKPFPPDKTMFPPSTALSPAAIITSPPI